MVRTQALNLVSQLIAHPATGSINRYIVQNRVRAREIHVFEDAGREHRILGALEGVYRSVSLDEDRFTRVDIANGVEAQDIESDILRCKHEVGSVFCFSLAVNQRPNSMRIAECQNPEARNHGNHAVGAPTPFMHPFDCLKNIFWRNAQLPKLVQFVGKNIEKDLGIRIGVEMPLILNKELMLQGFGIGQVAVMRQSDPVGRIHIEGLRF